LAVRNEKELRFQMKLDADASADASADTGRFIFYKDKRILNIKILNEYI
jgi:hypothetical protein